ncbi:hypothetical protein DFQ27_004898 [Actinomortierella ambigua]|uniref:Stress-associated endoplasmic reticulum protein n=1 Tax=Actinomortierella ambigua TaxID=1343610 RepID=A0A9P6Q0C4_9FUNG|nr:hypothetical protein DFQ27_004898 [Actinomortierella ambigua]
MTSATSPTIRARNAKYQGNVTKRGTGTTKKTSATTTKAPAIDPRVAYFLLVLMSGGAIFQVLYLIFGSRLFPDPMDMD